MSKLHRPRIQDTISHVSKFGRQKATAAATRGGAVPFEPDNTMLSSLRRKRKFSDSLPINSRSTAQDDSMKITAPKQTEITSEHHRTLPIQHRRKRQQRGHVLLCTTVLLVFVWVTTMVSTVRRFQPKWHNQYDIVHVVQTRFMQFQPHLLALGRARLKLFKALTLPSMKQQSSHEFLWIIRTDPDLDFTLRDELIESLRPLSNVVLVASNDNPEGFRGAISDITDESVLLGSLSLVHSYHEASTQHRLLETRLDADDALATTYCESLQDQANQYLAHDSWVVWCTDVHVEWQYMSPWNASKPNLPGRSSVKSIPKFFTDEAGALLGLKMPQCITPGLTWGLGTNTHRSQIHVRNNHAKLHSLIPECSTTVSTACLRRMTASGDLPMAMRGRTPTSAGMDRILQSESPESEIFRKSKWRHSQPELWRVLPPLFGIYAQDLWDVRRYINKNLYNIVKDGLDGQCTKGHSCKEQSRLVLQKLLDESGGSQGQHANPEQ